MARTTAQNVIAGLARGDKRTISRVSKIAQSKGSAGKRARGALMMAGIDPKSRTSSMGDTVMSVKTSGTTVAGTSKPKSTGKTPSKSIASLSKNAIKTQGASVVNNQLSAGGSTNVKAHNRKTKGKGNTSVKRHSRKTKGNKDFFSKVGNRKLKKQWEARKSDELIDDVFGENQEYGDLGEYYNDLELETLKHKLKGKKYKSVSDLADRNESGYDIRLSRLDRSKKGGLKNRTKNLRKKLKDYKANSLHYQYESEFADKVRAGLKKGRRYTKKRAEYDLNRKIYSMI